MTDDQRIPLAKALDGLVEIDPMVSPISGVSLAPWT